MKASVQYGVLIKLKDGSFIVWGPRRHESAFTGHLRSELQQDTAEFSQEAVHEWENLKSALAPIGELIDIIDLCNWTEIYGRLGAAEK